MPLLTIYLDVSDCARHKRLRERGLQYSSAVTTVEAHPVEIEMSRVAELCDIRIDATPGVPEVVAHLLRALDVASA
jgi:hypothetical protein